MASPSDLSRNYQGLQLVVYGDLLRYGRLGFNDDWTRIRHRGKPGPKAPTGYSDPTAGWTQDRKKDHPMTLPAEDSSK